MSDSSESEKVTLNSARNRGRSLRSETLADINQGSKKLEKFIESKKAEKMAKTTDIDKIIQTINKRFDELGERFDKQDSRIEELKKSMVKQDNKIDDMKKNIETKVMSEVKKAEAKMKLTVIDEIRRELKEKLKNHAVVGNDKEVVKRIENSEEYIERQERNKRMNNIVIYGVKFNKVKEEAVIWLEDNLKIKIEVVNGKMVKEDIALVMLKSREDKNTVMRNTCNLKGTKIYINEDFTAKEREIHWKVRKIASEWRE